MTLPFDPPLDPMLAKIAPGIPADGDWLFEPKWDGFRAILFRNGDELFVQSRDGRPLDRYFPELRQTLFEQLPERCVIDGEIVVFRNGKLAFGILQLRLHPAESRIQKLAAEFPSSFVAFDLLALDDQDLRAVPQSERRDTLERCLGKATPPVLLTPVTRDREVAQHWFDTLEGGGIEGLIAKDPDLSYLPKKRAMLKIKHVRTIDCVVGGFRWHKNGPGELVGSLLLGLYDDAGKLHHVGITSSFKMDMRRQLAVELESFRAELGGHPWNWGQKSSGTDKPSGGARKPAGAGGKGHSRWSRGKDLSFVPLRIERVVEVKYDYLQDGRFRHAASFLRWREDKRPEECTYEQVDLPAEADVQAELYGSS